MIAVLDYGVGNLRSVYKAFETVATPLGIPVDIVNKPVDLTRWQAVVLPGQGAFGDSVDNLRRQQLDRPLLDAVEAGLPLLGICVGMQLLFDASEEMGEHEGLHLIPGKVRRFPADMPDPTRPASARNEPQNSIRSTATELDSDPGPAPDPDLHRVLRVPQIGWNQLHVRRADPLLQGVPDGAYAYFAHSYYCDPAGVDAVLAATDYGVEYASIVRYQNAWGIQPHPEKSHTVGLRILRNFMSMVAARATTEASV